jgi:hypothetical protein
VEEILLEKLIVIQLLKKFPAFYRTRRFITVFIRARRIRNKLDLNGEE